MKDEGFPLSHQHLVLSLFIAAVLISILWSLTVILIFITLMINYVWISFHVLFDIL